MFIPNIINIWTSNPPKILNVQVFGISRKETFSFEKLKFVSPHDTL